MVCTTYLTQYYLVYNNKYFAHVKIGLPSKIGVFPCCPAMVLKCAGYTYINYENFKFSTNSHILRNRKNQHWHNQTVNYFLQLKRSVERPGKSILSKCPGEEKQNLLSHLPLLAGNNSVFTISLEIINRFF